MTLRQPSSVFALFSLLLTLCLSCSDSLPQSKTKDATPSHPLIRAMKKVMIVIFENKDYADTMQQPFFAKLANEGANFTQFYAERHPSQPNYIALISGSTHGVTNDDNVTINARHLGDLLEEQGKTWKVYAEHYPGNCFLGSRSGTYVRKHVPFLSFKNIQENAARCANIVEADVMTTDIANGTLPDFSFYVPDLNNDAHDTDIAFADHWYRSKFEPLLGNPLFMQNMLLITTFDEGSAFGDNRIYTSFYGYGVKHGSVNNTAINHYNLLKTLEAGLGLGGLGQHDDARLPVQDVWQ